jgi:endonuclease IV
MNKIRLDRSSDYSKVLEELNYYKKLANNLVNINEVLGGAVKDKQRAEETLNKVLDLINSSEDLAHFYSAKQEIRKPIEDYFKKVK